jgi:hypothetical protein
MAAHRAYILGAWYGAEALSKFCPIYDLFRLTVRMFLHRSFVSFVHSFVGWLVGWLVNWSDRGLVGWLVGWFVSWLAG